MSRDIYCEACGELIYPHEKTNCRLCNETIHLDCRACCHHCKEEGCFSCMILDDCSFERFCGESCRGKTGQWPNL